MVNIPLAFLAAFLLLVAQTAICEEPPATDPSSGDVAQEVLEAKIQEVESTTGMDEQVKAKLVDLYRQALSNLQTTKTNAEAAEAFRRAALTAPAQSESIREEMEVEGRTAPEEPLQLETAASVAEIAQMLQREKADLAAEDARRADFEQRLEEEAARPTLVQQRLREAKERQREIAAELKLPPPGDVGSATSEAMRWALISRYGALGTEIEMLDQELLSQPVRLDLLRIKRDRAAAGIQRVGARVKALEDLLNQKRQEDAEQARIRAEVTRREAEGRHPLVVQLAEGNARLTEDLAEMAAQLALISREQERTEELQSEVEDDFAEAKETVAIGGLSPDLGHILFRQRQSLPDRRSLLRQTAERKERLASIGLQRLRHREELKQLRDPGDYLQDRAADQGLKPTSEVLVELGDLATKRQALLEKALATDDLLLRKVGELDAVEDRLIQDIEAYDAFLNEHLLWVRSGSRARIEQLGVLPEQVWRILSPEGWSEVVRALSHRATHSPLFALLAVMLVALLWGRKRVWGTIQDLGERLGKPTTDRFVYSLQVLVLTLLVASAWPLVLLVTGWELKLSDQGTDFSSAVAQSLLIVAAQLFYLRALRLICMPGGLASAHFRWPEASLGLLRTELGRLTWIFIPAALVAVVAHHLDRLYGGWEIGRTAGLVVFASLAFAIFRLLHPKRGVLSGYLRHREGRAFKRLYPIWYALLVAAPLALASMSLLGFRYTAATLLKLLLETTWMAVSLIVLHALAVRWIVVTRRRLAYQAAASRRQALIEAREADSATRAGDEAIAPEVEEPEVDLAALSDASRKLLNASIVFSGVVGLLMIWSEVFPAFRILENINLWHHRVTVDGEQRVLPVTLADIGMALIYAGVTILLAKQLPAVLEIILLRRSQMSAGGRYTVTTLTNYAVITLGVVLVFKTFGVDWSKLQWLVAALGVGVGFGLQEIVANFISGLIILFERPVRVGDVVTVGDTDGTVTRIRIRATTIKNWDGKELLVPNKEFITGRLLNWSLSDQTTRLLITVGIAYGSNVRLAMRLLEEAAREHPDVLADPAPSVIFESFGDNALGMVLRCFVDSVDIRLRTISDLNRSINDKFIAAGIVVAFPQRDLHIDAVQPLKVEIQRGTDVPRPDGEPAGNA